VSLLVTLLTGRRPKLLARTLDSLRQFQPEVLEGFVLCLHNGGDSETREVLDRHRDVIDLVVTSEFQDIGGSTSLLFKHALEIDAEYMLHLEDDWVASPGRWYDQAQGLLTETFQVRLRSTRETVLKNHMVTGQPIVWQSRPGCKVSPDAHYTMNPSLIKLSDLSKGFPSLGERDAQRMFWEAGCRKVAQLPGVFRHIGGRDSLRLR
jgi:hypothetical protein